MKIFQILTNAFPVWVMVTSFIAFFYPETFTWFKGPWITYGLGVIMLGMGLTLSLEDFKGVLKYPLWVFLGVLFQYSIMPLLGWSLGYLFQLPTPFAIGLILVSCCPGGTASNVIAFLSRANVALSVTMTAISTLLAALMTPTLTTLLAQSRVEVNTYQLFISTVKVVILPVALGLLINTFFPKLTKKLTTISPLVAVIVIAFIVASIIGAKKEIILESGFSLLAAVITLHLFGFLLGYWGTKWLVKNKQVARTVSIEVGMQNSGLGAVLSRTSFPNTNTDIPSALSALTHCVIGSILAAVWGRSKDSKKYFF